MFRRRSLANLILLAVPVTLHAEEPTPSPDSEDDEHMIVLRHEIPVSETESASRVFDWTREMMEKHGASTPIEGLRRMPVFAGATRPKNESLRCDGTASINLYGLGAANVLTLINGRRAFGFADINAVSLGALSRAEILDAGLYGSDSTGGTVNLIMLNGPGEYPYEGVEIRVLYGNTTETDAHVRQVYLRGGVTGLKGKVSIAAAGEYYSRADLFSRDSGLSRTADLNNSAILTNPAVERSMSYITGRYKLFGNGVQLYGDILYSQSKQDNALGPTPISNAHAAHGSNDVRSSPPNPFFGNSLTSLRYRPLQERGLRESLSDRDYYRYVAGLNGDFDFKDGKFLSRFGYDTGFVYTTADQAASYIRHPSSSERDFLYNAMANGHLFPDSWNSGIELAAGYERWESNFRQTPDPGQASADSIGVAPIAAGRFRENVESWVFELGMPIVTSVMTVPGVRSLDLDVQCRREEHRATNLLRLPGSPVRTATSFTNANPDEDVGGTGQVTLRYQPFGDLMIRASWRQSIRPPAVTELFAPIRQGFPGVQPPPNEGIFVGGNPSLSPERTDSYSAGIVWNPTFVPGFTTIIDAYQLYTKSVIVDPSSFTQVILANEITDPDGCGLGVISGGPAVGLTRASDGRLDCIDSPYGNAGKRLVQGLQTAVTYEMVTDSWGKFTLVGGWNHFFTWKGPAGSGAATVSFLENYNNRTLEFAPGAIPRNKGFLRGEWEWKGLDFVVTGNYIVDFREERACDTIVHNDRRNVPSYITLDLQLSYQWRKPSASPLDRDAIYAGHNVSSAATPGSSIWQRLLWGTRVTAGVNNAFDRNPPTVLAALNDNGDTSLNSILNRYWYVAISKKF